MADNKNYTLKDWLDEPCQECQQWKKSWFLNGNIPKGDEWSAHKKDGCFYSDIEVDSRSRGGNIIQRFEDGSRSSIYLLGCTKLDFVICFMELSDGELEVDTVFTEYPIKYSKNEKGWYTDDYHEKLLDKNGKKIEDLIDFDHGSDDDLFRVPYTDLDINALANGEIVLTKEAEEKWKKILSGEIPATQPTETQMSVIQPTETQATETQTADTQIAATQTAESQTAATQMTSTQTKPQAGTLMDYFVMIKENGYTLDIPLYADAEGLYIKGDALESLKGMNETKCYLQTASGLVKDISQIKPSPETQLAGSQQGHLLKAGSCSIVSIRKKGEDENGNFDADTDILDELLQD